MTEADYLACQFFSGDEVMAFTADALNDMRMERESKSEPIRIATATESEFEAEAREVVPTSIAARYLGKSPQELRHWAMSGIGPMQPTGEIGANGRGDYWAMSAIRSLRG